MIVEQLGVDVQKNNLVRKSDYFAKRDLLAIDYLINEHPMREQLFGGDSSWAMTLPEDARSIMMQAKYPAENVKRAGPLAKVLQTMGYDNLDSDSSEARFNVTAHLIDRDS